MRLRHQHHFLALPIALLCATAPGTPLLAQAGWNARVAGFVTTYSIPAFGEKGYWVDEATTSTTFTQGELVHAGCRYEYASSGNPADLAPWTMQIGIVSQTMEEFPQAGGQASGGKGMYQDVGWIAEAPGTYQAKCVLKLDDADPSDNVAALTFTVVPRRGNVLGVFPAPQPKFLLPQPGARYPTSAGLAISVRLRIPNVPFGGVSDFATYAKSTAGAEKWRIELVRLGGASRGQVTVIGRVEGLVSTLELGTVLRNNVPAGFRPGVPASAGRYAVRVSLVQVYPEGVRVSPPVSTEFELFRPLVADLGDKPAPQAKAAPESTTTRRPGRIPQVAQPAGRPPAPTPRSRW